MTDSPDSPAIESTEEDRKPSSPSETILRGVVSTLLEELKKGAADRDKRRQVEEWIKSLADKYPDFAIEAGLRDYYLAEAHRLRSDFDSSSDLTEKLNLGRSVETFLEKASDYEQRISSRK